MLLSHQQNIYRWTDRMFALLMTVRWLAAIGIALWVSPQAGVGSASEFLPQVYAAIFFGGLISLLPIVLGLTRSGAPSTRYVIAIAQMVMGALLIHITDGRVETHFHVFGSLTFLACYRDWRVLILTAQFEKQTSTTSQQEITEMPNLANCAL